MATSGDRTAEQVKREIAAERELLAESVEQLRGGLDTTLDVSARLRPKLPLLAAGALGAAFVAAGGIGATMRLLARRGREGHRRATLGRFSVVERD